MTAQLKQTSEKIPTHNNQTPADSYFEILDNLEIGLFVFGENNLLKKVNRAGCQILELFCPDLSNNESWENTPLEVVFCNSAFDGWAKQIKPIRNGMKNTFHRNMTAISEDSQRIYKVSAVVGEESRSDLIVILSDITEQKENEQHLSDLEKLSEKGVLASWVAHDLNNILGLILGSAELAELAMKKNNIERVKELLGKIKANVSKMEQFTSDLTSATNLVTEKCKTDLNKLVTEVVSFVTGQKMFSRTSISTNIDYTLPEIELDSNQISQMLLHLLQNAGDAIAKTDHNLGHIEICTKVDGDSILLSVRDDGIGMTSEIKDKLFQRRFTTKEDNHGYSLMTCRNIMDNHNATVDIQSEVNEGSTFIFKFPRITNI